MSGADHPRRCSVAVPIVVALLLPGLAVAKGPSPIEIRAQYREVLGILAAGDQTGALARLIEFEQGVVGDEEPWRHIEDLRQAKVRVLRDLLESQPFELLRPVIMLHHDAYFEYARLKRPYLAGHSRDMAADLAQIHAKRLDTPEARQYSGWVLTSFGVELWRPTSNSDSAALFYRALESDPSNLLALMGLATAFERSGDYVQASGYLERLLALEPENEEARLRLALCQARISKDSSHAAIAQLNAVLRSDAADWIKSVAYQEQAGLWLALGDSGEAEEVLRQGLERLPGDQQIAVRLAAVLDRQRRPNEAARVLEQVQPDNWQQDSPRLRYDVWVPGGIEGTRSSLREGTKNGLVALGAGLLFASADEAGP